MSSEKPRFAQGVLLAGRFQVERLLGQGGTAEGYLCLDTVLDEPVVCKVGHSNQVRDSLVAQYFKLRRIRTPGVVDALGFFEHGKSKDRLPVVVLAWIEGDSLETWATKHSLKEKLDALAEIGAALSALHGEGITHGDFPRGVNVVAGDRGCVLIDPYPDLWGSYSVGSEMRHDLQSLGSLIEMLVPDYAARGLSQLLAELRASQSIDPERTFLVAQRLRTLSKNPPLLAGNDSSVAAAGEAYRERLEATNVQYRRNRQLRREYILDLASRISSLVKNFDLTVNVPAVAEDKEAERDRGGRGFFATRSIECRCLDDPEARWSIWFDEVEDFYRPAPYSGGVLASGTWRIAPYGPRGDIELVLSDSQTCEFRVSRKTEQRHFTTDPAWRPAESEPMSTLDDTWLRECLSSLTGAPSE